MGITWSRQHKIASPQIKSDRLFQLAAPKLSPDVQSVTDLVAAVEPAVVQIETPLAMGSGFVLDESGLVATCRHCIADTTDAMILFSDGRRERMIRVCGESIDRDVAIIKISRSSRLTALTVATREPKKGEPVIEFGAPDGLSFSVSEGSVSAIRTGGELEKIVRGPHFVDMIYAADDWNLASDVSIVQVTGSQTHGSSGGPVVDYDGNVMGICSFGLVKGGRQFTFCIAAKEIRRLAAELDESAIAEVR